MTAANFEIARIKSPDQKPGNFGACSKCAKKTMPCAPAPRHLTNQNNE